MRMMMTLQKMICLMVGASLLGACATTSPISPIQNSHSQDSAPTPSVSAKDTLASAVKSQMYHSFGYQTDVYVSNQARRELSVQDDDTPSENACNQAHDDAYVALLKQARQAHGSREDLEGYLDKNYSKEQHAIKTQYQTCMKKVFDSTPAYEPFDFDAFYQEYHALDTDQKAQVFLESAVVGMAEKTAAEVAEYASSNKSQDELDVKKAKLLDAYLLQPSHVSVMGSYHPIKGYITALPTAQYNAKNLHISINQPIHIDIKAGGIYLWADNFALANSQFLDKSLGDKWHNKWLFLSLNDGSLPKDFVQDFAKAYMTAKKESFLVTPKDSFEWVSADNLKSVPFLADNLPQATFATMSATPRIIKNELSAKDKAYRDYVFADVLYNTIIKKYPDLALEQALGYNPNTTERDIVDGESVITVRNADQSDDKDALKEPKLNARFFAVMFLSSLNQKVQGYYHNLQEPNLKTDQADTPSLVYYGMEGGKISWISQRYPLQKQLNDEWQQGKFAKTLSDVPMVVDVFTKIHQDASQIKAFARLPNHLQMPNADNSVNLLDYKDEFLKNLQQGNDKYLQTLMGLVFGAEATGEEELDEMDGAFEEP